jgi:hypothetical protein
LLDKNSIDKWDRQKAQFTSNFVGAMRHSATAMIKDMITSWADEEDKANAKYDSNCDKNNTGGNNNKKQQQQGSKRSQQ